MHKKIDPPLRMTTNDAMEKFPRDYILMQIDSYDMPDYMGTVLFTGDSMDELYDVKRTLNRENCCVIEGSKLQSSLGRVVVGA
jgi:hypothetical protein